MFPFDDVIMYYTAYSTTITSSERQPEVQLTQKHSISPPFSPIDIPTKAYNMLVRKFENQTIFLNFEWEKHPFFNPNR